MAILKSYDGTYYEVPDDQLENFKVPAEKLKEILAEQSVEMEADMASQAPAPGPVSVPVAVGGNPQVVVQIFTNGQAPSVQQAPPDEGDVKPQGRCGWNKWSNCR